MEPVKSYSVGELLTLPRTAKTNIIIDNGLLRDDALLAIVGPPKTAKSLILNTVLADIIIGRNLFGTIESERLTDARGAACDMHQPWFEVRKPARVLLIEQEIGPESFIERIQPLYETLAPFQQKLLAENLYVHSLDHTMQLDTNDGMARLHALVAKFKPSVLAFDPLIEMHSTNENDTQGMAKVMRSFHQLREMHPPLATIFCHHEGKPDDEHPKRGLARFRGSTVVAGRVDSAILLSIHNRDAMQFRLEFVVRRDRPIRPLYVRVDEATLRTEFICWDHDRDKKKKLAVLDGYDDGTTSHC